MAAAAARLRPRPAAAVGPNRRTARPAAGPDPNRRTARMAAGPDPNRRTARTAAGPQRATRAAGPGWAFRPGRAKRPSPLAAGSYRPLPYGADGRTLRLRRRADGR